MAAVAALLGYSQASRHIQIDTASSETFVVERFHGREGINESFKFEIDVLSAAAFLDLRSIIGSAVRLRLATDTGQRSWNGYISHAAYADSDGGLTRFRLTMESWLAFLGQRRNCLYFVDMDTQAICDRVFGDHTEAHWRYEINEPLRTFPLRGQYRELDSDFVLRQLSEAGLSFRFEHTQDESGSTTAPSGEHTLVAFDRRAAQPAGSPAAIPYNRVDIADPNGAITQFTERYQWVPDRVVTASWKASQVLAVSGHADAQPDPDVPVLPVREIFDSGRAGRFDTTAQAQQYAEQRLDALRLPAKVHYGAGAARSLEVGKVYSLTGYMPADIQFVPISIEHEAANNLGTEIAQLLAQGDLAQGYYRNRFSAVPPGVPIVPPHRDRPTVHGVQTAIVVGTPDSAVTSTRDHQVKIQFAWQRGTAPLPGGLTDTASLSNPQGHAPGDNQSGTWVRLAEQAAGPNFGHAFVPRVNAEVVVGFEGGNIDHPVVLGQLYGGRVQPPFAAGADSKANHPGTLSGMQTQTLDGQPGSQWIMDDAQGQLRHQVSSSVADSRLGTGYLIDQQGAVRGNYRGEGFELNTQGWAVLRANEGMLVSSTARQNAVSTQMDVAESTGQLQAAVTRAQSLNDSAVQVKAGGLEANSAQADFLKAIDPKQDGKYTGPVNGQSATKPTGTARDGGDPVERFAVPAVLFESPQSVALTTPNSAVAYAAEHVHLTSQGDTHLAAGATLAAAAGDAVSLYSAEGGLKAIANHGPLSIEAHAGTMEILADQGVHVISSAERVDVMAKDTIVLKSGSCTITLKGADITFACPGQFLVKAGSHEFLGGAYEPAKLTSLPNAQTFNQHFVVVDKATGQPAMPRSYEMYGPDYVKSSLGNDGKTTIVGSDSAENVSLKLGEQEFVSMKEYKA